MADDRPMMRRYAPWPEVLILVLGFGLLMARLPGQSVWVDELFTIDAINESGPVAVVNYIVRSERRPPLYWLSLHAWTQLAGQDEPALRFFSVFFAVLALILSYRMARTIGGRRLALLTLLLMILAPFLILYTPMIRSYSLALALAILVTWLFRRWLRRPTWSRWVTYTLASALLLYIDYTSLALLIAQGLFLLLSGRRYRSAWIRWLLTQLALAVLFLPWASVLLFDVSKKVVEADLARSFVGYGLKLTYPFYSYAVGETVFPWHPLAVLGVALWGGLLLVGVRVGWRTDRERLVFLVPHLFVPILFVSVLLSTVATDITFLNVPSRAISAVPFFYLLAVQGLLEVPRPAWRGLLLAGLIASSGYSLHSLYSGRQYHNPIYAVPMREIVANVVSQTQRGDVIISDWDTVFEYYYRQTGHVTPHFLSREPEQAEIYIDDHASPRVWMITYGRDRSRLVDRSVEIVDWLSPQYEVSDQWGYVRQDDTYSRLKAKLLGRPNYQYKALVRLFVRRF